MEHSPERELKLAAGADFRMPSIYGLGGTVVRHAPPERNATTYYDTDDLRLARWGASLRHRPGEGWTVKLPAERDAPFFVRPEIVFDGTGGQPPEAAVSLVRGFVREGRLDALVERLQRAGAGAPEQTAKYIRALRAHTSLAPEIAVPELSGDASAGRVVQRAIALSVIRLVLHDPVVRLDADPEGVHQARVATRRLRSDLRTFRALLEPSFARSLREELGWLARILGEVRDGDVLLERLRSRVAELSDDDAEGAGAILHALASSRDEAHARLLETLRSERYVDLLSTLVDAANAPPLQDEAQAPAADVVPALVRKPWHRLQKRVAKLGSEASDEQRHEIRIHTKRVRYAAEAVAPVVGKPARTFARAAAALQDALGDLNDAVVAAAWLGAWSAGDPDLPEARTAAALAALERTTTSAGGGWRDAWERLAAPELRSWM